MIKSVAYQIALLVACLLIIGMAPLILLGKCLMWMCGRLVAAAGNICGEDFHE